MPPGPPRLQKRLDTARGLAPARVSGGLAGRERILAWDDARLQPAGQIEVDALTERVHVELVLSDTSYRNGGPYDGT